jgi:predicted nucleic acid-binding protein
MRIYVDAELIGHVVQANVPILGRVTSRIFKAGVITVVSELTRMECLVTALQSGDPVLRQEFDIFLAPAEILNLTAPVFDRAAEIRATHGFTVVDAINLAAAAHYGCDEFLTRKRRLGRYAGVRVQVV